MTTTVLYTCTGKRRRIMERKLEGKVAVITGASKGIGEGIARTFVKHGANVVLAARGQAVEDLAAQLRAEGKPQKEIAQLIGSSQPTINSLAARLTAI